MEQNNRNQLCRNCGAPLNPGEKFCTSCGSPVQQQTPYQQPGYQQNPYQQPGYQQTPYQQPGYQQSAYYQQSGQYQPYGAADANPAAIRNMTKQEYRKACTDPKYLKQVKTAAIIIYVCIGLNALLMLLSMNLMMLVDIAITLPLAIIMHKNKSKGCAVGLLVYSIISVLLNVVVNGTFGGWLWLIAGVSAVSAFSIPDKQYDAAKLYQ